LSGLGLTICRLTACDMDSTIRIGKPYVTETDRGIRLNAKIALSGFDWGAAEKVLWIEADREYGRYFVDDRADAFLLGFVHYALRFGSEIICEAPVSVRLYEQLANQFIPWHLASFGKSEEPRRPFPIKITARTVPELEEKGTAVGAGVSCGVDSMFVFATKNDITHGIVWNMYPGNYRVSQEERDRAWRFLSARSKAFMDEIGKPLICLDTNYDTALFPEMWTDYQFTWANLFALRTLQKLLGKYYFASGNPIHTLQMDIHPWRCCCSYEPVLLPCLSASGTLIQIVGEEFSRMEKIRAIADYPPSGKYLHVCRRHGEPNCGCGCEKCQETMLMMDAIGVLDRFAGVFDVEYYRRHRNDYLLFYLQYVNRYTATDLADLRPYLRWKIPLSVYLRRLTGYLADRMFIWKK